MADFPIFVGQVTLRQRGQLPENSGIYFVFDKFDHLLYIGRTKNLKNRWAGSTHHRYKQYARKGLDKVFIRYILIPILDLSSLERNYIDIFKPLHNDSKVTQSAPKTKFSELQRLLKLTTTPLFPSCLTKIRNGEEIPREYCDLFRGFIAGIYQKNQPHIVVVCKQNMGQLLRNSFSHRTKKRFYLNPSSEYWPAYFSFDAGQVVFEFVEVFDWELAEPLFNEVYPNLVDVQIAGVMVKKLVTPYLLASALQSSGFTKPNAAQDYLLNICKNLHPLPTDLNLNQQTMG